LSQTLKEVVRQLGGAGITYREIKNRSGVGENALKQFMFRKTQKTRCSSLLTKLSSTIIELDQEGLIEKTPALSAFYFYSRAQSTNIKAYLQSQLDGLYKFSSNQLCEYQSQHEMILGAAQGSPRNLSFFCYQNSDRKGLVQKSEFRFFREPSLDCSQCFYSELAPSPNGDTTERHGIVRMTDGLITLLYFRESAMNVMHIRCFPSRGRASGISISKGTEAVSVRMVVFVPESRVASKEVEFLDFAKDPHELKEFSDGCDEIRLTM
jgi:hypothetical protein